MVIDIREHKSPENRRQNIKNKIGAVFKEKGARKNFSVKNPSQWLKDERNAAEKNDEF
jgi:hypothetical protein